MEIFAVKGKQPVQQRHCHRIAAEDSGPDCLQLLFAESEKDLTFLIKIGIDGSLADSGGPGQVIYAGTFVPFLGKQLHCRIKNGQLGSPFLLFPFSRHLVSRDPRYCGRFVTGL